MQTLTRKMIWTASGFFPVGVLLAFFFEGEYRKFVRFLFTLENGSNIGFYGKHIHLFASPIILISFGVFCSFFYLCLIHCSLPHKRLPRTLITVSLFTGFLVIVTTVHSKLLIIECTACEEGRRMLTFNEPNYDTYFMISLMVAMFYLFIVCFVEYQRHQE